MRVSPAHLTRTRTRTRTHTSAMLAAAARSASIASLSSRAAPARLLSSASAAATKPSTFRVLGLQQIAIGHLDKKELSALWQGAFGLEKVGEFKSEKENVDEDILILGPKGPLQVEVDLMQPLDADKSPKVHVPNLNHIGLWVDDIHAAVKELSSKGVRFAPGGVRKGAAGYDVTFLHPKGDASKGAPIGGCGVLIELVQAPPEVIQALGGGKRA